MIFAAISCAQETPGKQVALTFEKKISETVKLQYLLYLPKDYAKEKEWPLLLFLHGSGERGSNLELVKKQGPPKLISQGQDFPFIVVSPQLPADYKDWSPKALIELVNHIEHKYKVDKKRIYVTGLSMGGYGTWNLALEYPDRFAAIAPVCGGADTLRAAVLKDIPVWVFHGARDNVVPIEEDSAMVEAVKRSGGCVRFTIYPEAGHDAWTETYNNPEFYDWLLGQHR
jgi:predicted peptidase